MLLNLLINDNVLKEMICQDKYRKIKLLLKQKQARSANIADTADVV